jgi:Ca2+-binding EF-hand superfamily protein
MFTPQQQQGGPRFSSKTRIGNWLEDEELDQVRFKDYLKRKEGSQLAVHLSQQKLSKSLTKVGHSFSYDGGLHFGDKLMFINKQTKGFLACDVWDKIPNCPDPAFAVTSSASVVSPVARAVFILERVEDRDGYPGDQVFYGQKLRLRVHPYLSREGLWLSSCPISPQSFARFSRHQEVSVSSLANASSTWVIEHADSKLRFEAQGSPVPANQPILIKHQATGQWLAADHINYRNDFGNEFEVCSHSFLIPKRTQQLGSEKAGKLVIDTPARHQGDQNIWMAVTSQDPSLAEEHLPDEAQASRPDHLLAQIKASLQHKGTYGIRGLARALRSLGERLDAEDFKWGLYNYGIVLSTDELRALTQHFDRSSQGTISVDEFISTLKGKLNDFRLRLLTEAYQKLDKNGDGQVTLDDIARNFNATRNPEVLQGRKTEGEVFNEFITNWDTQDPRRIVTLSEFARYYDDISGNIENDQAFEALIRSAWRL